MRHLAWLTVLFAALVLVSGCGLLPKEEQPPFTAVELDRLLMDNPVIRDAMQLAASNCRHLSRAQGMRVVLAARDDKVRDLGWDLDRYNYVLDQCRLILERRQYRLRITRFQAELGTARQDGRDELLQKLADHKQRLRAMEELIATRLSVSEQVLIDERMDALLADLADDTPIIQPYTPQ